MVARLSEWRERTLAAATATMKECGHDERDEVIAHLKGKVAQITMTHELLEEKITALEANAL